MSEKVHVISWILSKPHLESCPRFWGDPGNCNCGKDECHKAIAELLEAATEMSRVQVNRRPSMRNDLGSSKKNRLRQAIKRVRGIA